MKKKLFTMFLTLILIIALIPAFSIPAYALGDTYTTISAGDNYSMAIKNDGSLWGWGINDKGQLGDGTFEDRNVPTHIMDDVVMVSAGQQHTLAVTSDGTLWGWGNNMYESMGSLIAIDENTSTPTRLTGGVVSASAGMFCSAFITADGRLWLSTSLARDMMLEEEAREHSEANGFYYALDNVVDVQATLGTVYALKSDNSLWLYDGEVAAAAEWVKVQDDVKSFALSVNGNLVVVKTDKTLWSTRYDIFHEAAGELVYVMDDVSAAAFNVETILIQKSDNTVWHKGRVLGWNNDDFPIRSDELVQLSENIVSICLGNQHAIALSTNGEIYCWGYGSRGQLGTGGFDRSLMPVLVGDGYMLPTGERLTPSTKPGTSELPPVNLSPPKYAPTGVGVTGGDVCAVARPYGTMWAWGTALGEEPTKYLDNVAFMSASSHIMALQTDGTLWGVGENANNQIDGSSEEWHREPVKIMENIADVSAGVYYTLALQTDGTVWAWGYNENGRLGDGGTESRSEPVQVLDGVISIYAGENISLAIRSDNSLWAWGTGAGLSEQLTPIAIMDDVVSAKTWLNCIVVLKADGTLLGWGGGNNFMGADGTMEEPALLMENVRSFDLSGSAVFAVDNSGALLAWGENSDGQLGNETQENVSINSPFQVMDDVASVSASDINTMAVKNDGTVWVWGLLPDEETEAPSGRPLVSLKSVPVPSKIEFEGEDTTPNSEAPQSQAGNSSTEPRNEEKQENKMLLPLIVGGSVVAVGAFVAIIAIIASERKKRR